MTPRKIVVGLLSMVTAVPEQLITYLPGPVGYVVRRTYYRRRVRSMGRNVLIDVGAQLVNPSVMSFGDNCWIDKYAVLMAGRPHEGARRLFRERTAAFDAEEGELVIGANCHVGPHAVINAHGGVSVGANTTIAAGAKLYSLTHHHSNPADPSDRFLYSFTSQAPEERQSLRAAPIAIGENAAVGLNSVVLPGAVIGRDAWVGVCSLVTGEIPAGAIAFGVPARPVKWRPGYE